MATKKRGTGKKRTAKKGATKKKAVTKKRSTKKKAATKKRSTKEKAATKKRGATKKKATTKKKSATKKRSTKKGPTKRKASPKNAATKKRASKKAVDDYLSKLSGWQAQVAALVRRSIHHAAPDAEERLDRGRPLYDEHGPVAFLEVFGNHVDVGFPRGAQLVDSHGLLDDDTDHVRRMAMTRPEELKPQYLEELVRQAVTLNRELGPPSRVERNGRRRI